MADAMLPAGRPRPGWESEAPAGGRKKEKGPSSPPSPDIGVSKNRGGQFFAVLSHAARATWHTCVRDADEWHSLEHEFVAV